MSGIGRASLPTSVQGVEELSLAIRAVLFDTCDFKSVAASKSFTPARIDDALEKCEVRFEVAQKLQGLVEKLRKHDAPIPNDFNVCEVKLDSDLGCDDVHLSDNLEDIEILRSRCPHIGKITFRGRPSEFPRLLCASTNFIEFQPRFKYVSLNHDIPANFLDQLALNRGLRIHFKFGVIDLSGPSILDHRKWDQFKNQIQVDRTVIVGPWSDSFIESVRRLKEITKPYVSMSISDPNLQHKMALRKKLQLGFVFDDMSTADYWKHAPMLAFEAQEEPGGYLSRETFENGTKI
jgi:hypothetical protein